MGQRLVLNVYKTESNIENNENSLCSIYYHWSARTYDAIINTIYFYKSYSKYIKEYEDEVAVVLSVLKCSNIFKDGIHGGVHSLDHEYFVSKYNDKYPDIVSKVTNIETIHHCLGLVGFTDDTKDIINNVGEMFITLCLDQDSENPRPWIDMEDTCWIINDEEKMSDVYRYELEVDNIQKVYLDTIDEFFRYALQYDTKITSKYQGTVYENI